MNSSQFAPSVSEVGVVKHQSVTEQLLRLALYYAAMAPSTHNMQPWRFIVQDNTVLLCVDRTRSLPMLDPYDRELIISCGAALFNLRVALAYLGQSYAISLLPNPSDADHLATIKVGPSGYFDPDLAGLFWTIPMRATQRQRAMFDKKNPLQLQELQTLICAAADCEGIGLTIPQEEVCNQIAGLVVRADRIQHTDAAYRHEWATLLHASPQRRSSLARAWRPLGSCNQIGAYQSGNWSIGMKTEAPLNPRSRESQAAAMQSTVLVVLSTPRDDMASWLAAGQGLERILLNLTAHGYAAAFINQVVEIEFLRTQLQTLMRREEYPQILMWVGKRHASRHATKQRPPRRTLAEIVS